MTEQTTRLVDTIKGVSVYSEHVPDGRGSWRFVGYVVDDNAGNRRQVPDLIAAEDLAEQWAKKGN